MTFVNLATSGPAAHSSSRTTKGEIMRALRLFALAAGLIFAGQAAALSVCQDPKTGKKVMQEGPCYGSKTLKDTGQPSRQEVEAELAADRAAPKQWQIDAQRHDEAQARSEAAPREPENSQAAQAKSGGDALAAESRDRKCRNLAANARTRSEKVAYNELCMSKIEPAKHDDCQRRLSRARTASDRAVITAECTGDKTAVDRVAPPQPVIINNNPGGPMNCKIKDGGKAVCF